MMKEAPYGRWDDDYLADVPRRDLDLGCSSALTVSEEALPVDSRRATRAVERERARLPVSGASPSASAIASGILRACAKKSLASRSQMF